MSEEKFAAFMVRIWRARRRLEWLRRSLNAKDRAARIENAKDDLRLVLLRFQAKALA